MEFGEKLWHEKVKRAETTFKVCTLMENDEHALATTAGRDSCALKNGKEVFKRLFG
jgi:hypothetical protein